jgi:membrane protease YdiL (CAAX protease family)
MNRWQRIISTVWWFAPVPVVVYIALCYLILNVTLIALFKLTPFLVAGSAAFVEPLGEFVVAFDAIAAMWIIFRFLERRSMLESGFNTNKAWSDMAFGFAIGLALVALMVAAEFLLGVYRPLGLNLHCNLISPLIVFLFVGVAEEVIFRVAIFQLLERRVGTWPAFAVSCIIFGLAHMLNNVGGESLPMKLIGCACLMLEAGIVLNAAFLVRRTLWLGVGMHWAWNFFEGPFFGMPVSGNVIGSTLINVRMQGPELLTGGKFGPEGSLTGVLLGTIFGVVMLRYAVLHGKAIQAKPTETARSQDETPADQSQNHPQNETPADQSQNHPQNETPQN